MQVGLPQAAHGNPVLVFTIQAREIFLVWAGVGMESLWTLLGGEETASRVFQDSR